MRNWWIASLAFAMACAPKDSDGDGLTDAEEVELGTDPESADGDDDGADDPDEIDAGTNPNYEWSYPIAEGNYLIGNCPDAPDEENSGPTGESLYQNPWPAYQEGDTLANVAVTDSFDQELYLYNFCGNYTLITLGAQWCGPCQNMASALPEEVEAIREEVPNFGVFEIVYEALDGSPADTETLVEWSTTYELDGIPVVVPTEESMDIAMHLNMQGTIPTTVLVGPDLEVIWSGLQHDGNYISGASAILAAIGASEE